MPYLTGKQTSRPHQTLYWRYGPQWAIRHGDLKLVVSKGGSGQPELYNLATDIGESKDLAAAQPAKVKELQAMWDKWSAEQAPASTPDSPVARDAHFVACVTTVGPSRRRAADRRSVAGESTRSSCATPPWPIAPPCD
eukprot:gene23716-44286_t